MTLLAMPPADDATWRQREAVLFRAMRDMEDGVVPNLAEAVADPMRLRRLGYLAELVAHFRNPPSRAALLAFAAAAHGQALAGGAFATESAVPGGSVLATPQRDALAAKWGFHPGLDLARYAAETVRRPHDA